MEPSTSTEMSYPADGSPFPKSELREGRVDSLPYYDRVQTCSRMKPFVTSKESKPKKDSTKHSKHLPYWAWYIIAKLSGIPLQKGEKPLFGTVMHIFAFSSALIYAVSHSWYVAYDIMSNDTKQDIPNGSISIFLTVFWCAFGFYAKTLSGRLFLHPQFLKDIRMHSRTFFKVNAVLVIVLVGAAYMVVSILAAIPIAYDDACEIIDLNIIVCKLLFTSRVAFCIVNLIWSSLVSFVFITVCRTHTIGLRNFIQGIEHDAILHEQRYAKLHMQISMSQEDFFQENQWLESEQLSDDVLQYHSSNGRNALLRRLKAERNTEDGQSSCEDDTVRYDKEIGIIRTPITDYPVLMTPEAGDREDFKFMNGEKDESHVTKEMKNVTSGTATPDESFYSPHTMSIAEILHHYWKISCRLQLFSMAMQRWFASLVALVILNSSTYLVHWLSKPATLYDILQFVLPLMLLTLLASVVAEVNMEGRRFLRCIYPSEDRMKIMQFLNQNPLQVSVYGFSMTHGTIVTVVFAVLVGFITRIIITEITK